MEYIKKTIKQAITTEKSTGNTFNFIPDLNANYYMKILLTNRALDLGVFDEYNEELNNDDIT